MGHPRHARWPDILDYSRSAVFTRQPKRGTTDADTPSGASTHRGAAGNHDHNACHCPLSPFDLSRRASRSGRGTRPTRPLR